MACTLLSLQVGSSHPRHTASRRCWSPCRTPAGCMPLVPACIVRSSQDCIQPRLSRTCDMVQCCFSQNLPGQSESDSEERCSIARALDNHIRQEAGTCKFQTGQWLSAKNLQSIHRSMCCGGLGVQSPNLVEQQMRLQRQHQESCLEECSGFGHGANPCERGLA